MALFEIQQAEVNRRLGAFCEAPVPPAVRNKVRIGFRIKGTKVVMFEGRPAFQRPPVWREMAVAKFRYVGTQRLRRLYCQHRDLRWHSYEALPAAPSPAEDLE